MAWASYIQRLATTIMMVVVSLFVVSCTSEDVEKKKRVLVIHSMGDTGEDGEPFRKCMAKAFEDQGLDVEISHIYMDLVKRRGLLLANDWKEYRKEIKEWKPDVMLVNGDAMLDLILFNRLDDSLFSQTPTVFAGINCLLRDSLVKFPNMTGFEEPINLMRNLEVATELTGTNSITIELDYTPLDRRMRKVLEAEIAKYEQIENNSDFHIENTDSIYIVNNYPGKFVVNFISCAHPEKNEYRDAYDDSKLVLGKHFYKAKHQWHMQVKNDLFSNVLLEQTRYPQFTCIRDNFNNPQRTRFAGGYFTSVEIQINDQVRYASLIMQGTAPQHIPIGTHLQEYVLDYNALINLPRRIEYKDVCDKYRVVNVPFKYCHPLMYLIGVVALSLLICLFVVLLVYLLLAWKKIGMKRLLESMLYEDRMNQLLFSRRSDTIWYLKGSVMHVTDNFAKLFRLPSPELTIWQLREMVEEDSVWALNTLLDFKNQRGRKAVRMHVTPDNGQHWYWVEAIYTVTEENVQKDELYGILINVDDKKAIENKLSAAHQKNSEVELKQRFLANISHDLRTPLNAIHGFSSLLTSGEVELTDEDRQNFCRIIHQNTEMILHMIDGVVQKSQIESGDIEMYASEVSVTDFVNECFMTNNVMAPANIKFKTEIQKNDVLIKIDITRTKQVINNFLSNAFKFTPSGSVVLGWHYIASEKMVEIYVRDTGIGLSKEKSEHIFDRYYKADENDCGTGLGLDISKTIMEKQNGKIGVRSELKKGSTFFIRVQRYMAMMILVLTGVAGITSCNLKEEPKHVIVLHNYDKELSSYEEFDKAIATTLREYNIEAEIKNEYLYLEDNYNIAKTSASKIIESVQGNGWGVDVILLEGDRAFRNLMADYANTPSIHGIPIVAASLHHPDWEIIRKHKNIVPILDPIDYCANINLAAELSGSNLIDIELDYFALDTIKRNELCQAISRPPYVNNCDFHLGDPNPVMPHIKAMKDSIIVTTFSGESPERNNKAGYSDMQTSIMNIYMHSWVNPSIAVKYDLFSSMIADKSQQPQYTAVKSGFGEGNMRYLAGYFASFETVGQDGGMVVAKLLRGDDAKTLSGLTHKKEYYMDYTSMKALGMKYEDYSDRFVITGAPFSLAHRWLFIFSIIGGILITLAIIVASTSLAMKWREEGQRKLLEHIMRKADIRKLALLGAESRDLKGIDVIEDIVKRIHPSQSDIQVKINQALIRPGRYTFEIKAELDESDGYHWWQLRFVNIMDDSGAKRIDGIIINIDEQKKREDELRKASILAEEAQKKENFLKTISHEIRTPLNAVVGFSDVLINTPQEKLNEADVKYMKAAIDDNNEYLKKTLEEVLMFSRVESLAVRFINEDLNLNEIMMELYEEWSDKMPAGVALYSNYHRDDIYIYADHSRVKFILNELMSNAVKFTQKGFIQLGTIYNYITDEVTISISDSGCGISKEKQMVMFDLFWKDDNFTRGLGLGLNISQKLANGMNATIKVNSGVGRGSVFYMILPAQIKQKKETID